MALCNVLFCLRNVIIKGASKNVLNEFNYIVQNMVNEKKSSYTVFEYKNILNRLSLEFDITLDNRFIIINKHDTNIYYYFKIIFDDNSQYFFDSYVGFTNYKAPSFNLHKQIDENLHINERLFLKLNKINK